MTIAALVVAHPGHELMVHHWMEQHQPVVFCLTDGSGGASAPRLESTRRLLRRAGAKRGAVFGPCSDRELYRMLLDHDTAQFVAIRDRIAAELIDGSIDCVAGDAMEGFNPVHDVCRALIDGAINVVRERTRRDLVNLEFSVDPLTDAPIAATPLIVPLDEEAIERKIAAALDYPEMRGEVQQLLERFGRNAFAEERLRESHTPEMLERFASTPPKYEEYGAMRVGEGRYSEVIRFAEHVLPVAIAVGAATARCAS